MRGRTPTTHRTTGQQETLETSPDLHSRSWLCRDPGIRSYKKTVLCTGATSDGGVSNFVPFAFSRGEVSEQIAVALTRLQHDMHSVLTRLSTLEALSVAAQARRRSRTPSPERRAQVRPQQGASLALLSSGFFGEIFQRLKLIYPLAMIGFISAVT